jgi:hypothetical protein
VEIAGVLMLLCSVGAYYICKNKGRSDGAVWALICFFLPIFILFLLFTSGDLTRECPQCGELILKKARVCKHCRSKVRALAIRGRR